MLLPSPGPRRRHPCSHRWRPSPPCRPPHLQAGASVVAGVGVGVGVDVGVFAQAQMRVTI